MTEATPKRPLLVYDGDCGICREWVNYWRQASAAEIDCQPYQEVAAAFPHIPESEFRRSIQLFNSDGRRLDGAAAAFHVCRDTTTGAILDWCYRCLPGAARVSEAGYRFLSRHRGLLTAVTRLLWGRDPQPARFVLTGRLFLLLLGLIYIAAFTSFGMQASGLIGADGLLPLDHFLDTARRQLGREAWLAVPGVFWLASSDLAIQAVCVVGAICAAAVVLDFLPRTMLALCFLFYLSLVGAGQAFMAFQWDLLLLEAGFLAVFLPTGSRILVWLYRWLVFRFMFMGGAVKIISADPAWDSLTALNYHFETQPLPTVAAWYAHQLPATLLGFGTAATLFIELLLPFLIILPRRPRMTAAVAFLLVQGAIALTGNYNFFNLLTMTLCLFLFDDAALARLLPAAAVRHCSRAPPVPSPAATRGLALLAVLVLFVSTEQMARILRANPVQSMSVVSRALAPCRCINSYGPFAIMTTTRHEIVIESSVDGHDWHEYAFRYKPGALDRIGGWVIPHQPRLDWQMWFAALSTPGRQPWFHNLVVRLLENRAAVTALLAEAAMPGPAPKYVRALLYRYQFTSAGERRQTGNWWRRELVGTYFPAAHISKEPGE